MSNSAQRFSHSVARLFRIGCALCPIILLFLVAAVGILQDSFAFCLFGSLAVVVFGPVGGMVSQTAHDPYKAGRLRSLDAWDFLVLIAIGVELLVAGEALFHTCSTAFTLEQID